MTAYIHEQMYDNEYGTISTALGASSSGTSQAITNLFVASPGFASLATGQFIKIALEVLTGNYEIIYIVAYTSGSRSCTILRGMEGTAAVAHSSGATWIVCPTSYNFTPPGKFNIMALKYGAMGNGTNDDLPAINAAQSDALANGPGSVVYFPSGFKFGTSGPIVTQASTGIVYEGDKGGTPSSGSPLVDSGSIVQPLASWSNPTWHSTAGSGVFMMIENNPGSSPTVTKSVVYRNLFVDASLLNASVQGYNVDGFTGYGDVNNVDFERIVVSSATGNGWSCTKDATSGDTPDGWHFEWCLAQGNSGNGWGGSVSSGQGHFTDSSFINCHAQGNDGDGFYITGDNNRFSVCRSDLNTNGYTTDFGTADGYASCNTFSACGTQRNQANGWNIINTSSGGTSWRSPVILNACSAEGDGVGGGAGGNYAGMFVSGQNIVTMTNCNVMNYTLDMTGSQASCPQNGVTVDSTNPGLATLRIDGGYIGHDTSGVSFNQMSDAKDYYVGPATIVGTGYEQDIPGAAWGVANLMSYYTDLGSTDFTPSVGGGAQTVLTTPSLPRGRYLVRFQITIVNADIGSSTDIITFGVEPSLSGSPASITTNPIGGQFNPGNATINTDNGGTFSGSAVYIVSNAGTLDLTITIPTGMGGTPKVRSQAQSGTYQATYVSIDRQA